MWHYFWRPFYRKRKQKRTLIIGLIILFLLYFITYGYSNDSFHSNQLLGSDSDSSTFESVAPFDNYLPSDRFDLFWAIWSTDQSTYRGRHQLALESIFIHYPQATVIVLSPTLNDTQLFQPYRHRGYRISSFNVSVSHILRWNWYVDNKTRDVLEQWNATGTYSYRHFIDYLRTVAMYLYGGTYLDMSTLILQPLPNQDFIGYDYMNVDKTCDWCIRNTSNLYLSPSIMRFRPYWKVLRHILQKSFDLQVYDPSCIACTGPMAYTQYIIEARRRSDSEILDIKLLAPHRLYPYTLTQISDIFQKVERDITLELADLMKRSYTLHLFGHVSDAFDITRGSLIDHLFDRYDLRDIRPKISNQGQSDTDTRLICPSLYIYTLPKDGEFLGRDTIYFRFSQKLSTGNDRWDVAMTVSNGSTLLPDGMRLLNRDQAQINTILNTLTYEPLESTSIDTLVINVKNEDISVSCSIPILIFSQWVTVLTKTMGTPDRWPSIRLLAESVERYFPETRVLVASDSGQPIDKTVFLNSTSIDNINRKDVSKTITIYDLPEDSGLSKGRNYLVNQTITPFFFLLDDDFELEEDSHLDILLEFIYSYQHIDVIAGKIPENIRMYFDFSGFFLRYGQTLELVPGVTHERRHEMLFRRSNNEARNDEIPCRQVDFVPNVFMGRTKSFQSIHWDDEFKVGEHEDFFMRFAHAKRNVYTCRYIHVHHHQIVWWKQPEDPYSKKRARAYEFFEKMLEKHHLKKMISFGITVADIS